MTRAHHVRGRQWLWSGAAAIAICSLGALADRKAYFASWLAAWWTCAGVILGSQANLWLHDLSGGAWGLPLRPVWRRATAAMPILIALMLPLMAAAWMFYPWGQAGWAPGAESPGFKAVWLAPPFVVARLVVYAALWQAMTSMSGRGAPNRRLKGMSAMGLIFYGLTISLAGVDLVLSLMPQWYSSGFGLIAITMQMKLGFALGIVGATSSRRWRRSPFPAQLGRDWGNMLLMYVLMWAYIAFVQFLIIWAENLPNEIAWYVPRLQTGWVWLGVVLVSGGFFAPLMLLLFRAIKQDRTRLRAVAIALCVIGWLESLWIVLPSVKGLSWHAMWMAPLALAGMLAIGWGTATSGKNTDPSGRYTTMIRPQEGAR